MGRLHPRSPEVARWRANTGEEGREQPAAFSRESEQRGNRQ
jgi:hypothetical protein